MEFAILAAPFLALLFGIIELGMMFLLDTTLEGATADAARQIRTCQLQNAGGATASSFKALVCSQSEVSWLGANCTANLQVDVRTFATFSATAVPDPVSHGQFDANSLMFQLGGAGDIVLVRAYYPWTLIAPSLDGAIQSLSNGTKLISAATTFRNEPCS